MAMSYVMRLAISEHNVLALTKSTRKSLSPKRSSISSDPTVVSGGSRRIRGQRWVKQAFQIKHIQDATLTLSGLYGR
jgi:hypothetical protein